MNGAAELWHVVYSFTVDAEGGRDETRARLVWFPESVDGQKAHREVTAMLLAVYGAERRPHVSQCFERAQLLPMLSLFDWQWAPRCATYPDYIVLVGSPRAGATAAGL